MYWGSLKIAVVISADTTRYVLDAVAFVGQIVESSSFAAVVETWSALHANEIPLAIARRAEETVFLLTEEALRCRGTTESQVSFRIAGFHLVGPVASIRFLVEGETFGTVEDEATAVNAVFELAAVVGVAHFVVTELMRAFFCCLSWFCYTN